MNPVRKYEGLFIFAPELGPEAWKEEEKRIEETIRRFGGRTVERNDWGRRPLGYAIRKSREGHMVLWNFEMETSRLEEFRKVLQLDENVLTSMIVKPPKPKPVREPRRESHHREPSLRREGEEAHGRKP